MDVVEIRSEPDESVNPGEPLRIIGDPRDPEVLRAAGVDNAAMVYACDERSATNIATALAVARAAGADGAPISVHGMVSDPDFCCTVQAFFLGREAPERVRLDFFNLDHIAARRLLADRDWPLSEGAPPHVLVAGTDGFGRGDRRRGGAPVARRRRCVVRRRPDGHARRTGCDGIVAGGLRRRYPFLATACRLQARNGELLQLIRRGALPEPPDRVLVSHPDEEYALETAMTAEQYWRGRSESVTVRMDGALIGGRTSFERLDVANGGTLEVFSKVAAAGDPELIQDDLMERIARVLHDRYVLARLSRGDDGPDPAMVGWDELPLRLRRANRAQAEDIGRKLAHIGYAITPRYADRLEVSLADADLDHLAKLEHQRWFTENWDLRLALRGAPRRGAPAAPALRAWPDLPEAIRLRNYDPFLALPAILGEAGFQIVRARAAT